MRGGGEFGARGGEFARGAAVERGARRVPALGRVETQICLATEREEMESHELGPEHAGGDDGAEERVEETKGDEVGGDAPEDAEEGAHGEGLLRDGERTEVQLSTKFRTSSHMRWSGLSVVPSALRAK